MFNIHKIVYQIGSYFRNKYLNVYYNELKSSEKLSLKELHELQEERLKKLLYFAKSNSLYYNKKFKDVNIEFITLDNLSILPSINKSDLLNFTEEIHSKNIKEKLIDSETSGSSGEALLFRRNLSWDAYHRASILRGYSWYGIKPWDKNMYFWGFNPSFIKLLKIRFFDFLLNRYRVFSFKEKDLLKLAPHLKESKYIEGYSSGIYKVSKFFAERKETFLT